MAEKTFYKWFVNRSCTSQLFLICRRNQNISVEEMSKLTSTNIKILRYIENGKTRVTPYNANKLLKPYKIPILSFVQAMMDDALTTMMDIFDLDLECNIKQIKYGDNMRDFKYLGKAVKTARLEQGMSQLDLSKALGYKNGQFISNCERGICGVPDKKLLTLSELLNRDPIYFIKAVLIDRLNYINEITESRSTLTLNKL